MITQERAREILQKPELQQGLKNYQYIMQQVHAVNVSTDQTFQKTFETFYKLNRYPKEFRNLYFKLMQEKKNQSNISFKEIYDDVKYYYNKDRGGKARKEISFSSKLLHTLNDSYPIWDSVLTDKKHFNLRCNVETAVEVYKQYTHKYFDHVKSSCGQILIELFDEEFPVYKNISDVKKIDFILWQDR